MRSIVDCMVTMQWQQIELVEAVRRLNLPAVVSGATQATASLSETTSVPTAVLAGASSPTTTTLSGIGELLLLINVGASGGLQFNCIGHFFQATMFLVFLCVFEGIVICVAKYSHLQVNNGGE